MTDHVHTTARRAAAVFVTLLLAAVIPGIGPLGHVGRAHGAEANGLVAYWPLDEGSGNTSADVTGDGSTLNFDTGVGWTSTTAPLHIPDPWALSFAGNTHSYATTSGIATDTNSTLTVAFWMRIDQPAVFNQALFSLPGRLLITYENDDSGPTLAFNFGADTFYVNASAINFIDGRYHHIAVTVSPSLGSVMYVDGVHENDDVGAFQAAGSGVILGDPVQPFQGELDDVRIYDRALTGAQVAGLAAVVPCSAVTGIPVSECNALQALWDNTDPADWTRTDNWFATTTPCDWYGVFCDTDTGHVVGLSLPDNGLVGAFPSGLSGLSHLVVLNLSGNQLSGIISNDLGALSALQTLNLSGNRLSEPIPVTLGLLSALHFLELNDNALSGEIPSQLANLGGLVILNLSDNGLTATDPTLVAFLNSEESDWAATQTVAPSNVSAEQLSPSSIAVSWSPIAYTGDGGYYDVLVQPQSTGVFTSAGHTANKSAKGFTITGLDPGDTYLVSVRTFTPAHGTQPNDILSDASDPVAPSPPVLASYTSNYGPDEYRFLYTDAVYFHRTDLASTQHDAAMFVAYLGGIIESQGRPPGNLGNQPGTGPLAVTTAYDPADTTAIQHAATLFSSDPATIQHVGVDLVAYLLIISGHH
jgi:Concanavalin A-like lectin/glucanases superfamily/Fibronectin type III domain/Leucine rich repeat